MRGWVIAGVLVVLGFVLFSNASQDRVHVIELRSSGLFGDVVSGRLLTEGSSGQIYVWVEQNERMMCPKRTFIQSNTTRRFQFTCRSLQGSGTFTLKTSRSPPSWVRENALSL